MSKNIVICLDGTWNDKDDPNAMSNVALLHDMSIHESYNRFYPFLQMDTLLIIV